MIVSVLRRKPCSARGVFPVAETHPVCWIGSEQQLKFGIWRGDGQKAAVSVHPAQVGQSCGLKRVVLCHTAGEGWRLGAGWWDHTPGAL